MRILSTFFPMILVIFFVRGERIDSTVEVLNRIYHKCADSDPMLSCVKPRLLTYMSEVGKMDKIPITEDLSIVGTSKDVQSVDTDEHYPSADPAKKEMFRSLMLEKLDNYLLNHHLEIKLPQAIVESNIVPRSLVDSVPKSLSVPLLDATQGEGRGFVKKVMIPFLLGLKFNVTALVPIALALIALKTWKALTLGLLSLVLSGAMLIFKLTKPKVAYEVVHYGHPPVEHAAPHWDTSAHGPYRAYRK